MFSIGLLIIAFACTHAADLETDSFLPEDVDHSQCEGPLCFNFTVDWSSGSAASTLPTFNFSVRKVEYVYYPADAHTYAYADIVNFTDLYYPGSYSSEVGVFSSPNGRTNWTYHGIVLARGPAGGWDSGGIASPGAAVAPDGSVFVGFVAENSPRGGHNRGIGMAIAPHPLGPFTKNKEPVASPAGLCGGAGRCDDIIMQARPDGEIHLYHSVKGNYARYPHGGAIVHHVTKDAGKTWSEGTVVLEVESNGTGTVLCVETIAGKFFPNALGGRGAMVLFCDGAPKVQLTAFLSPNMSQGFQSGGLMTAHPPDGRGPQPPSPTKGDWAVIQVAFVPDSKGDIVGVSYSRWTGEVVNMQNPKQSSSGYSHTIFDLKLQMPSGQSNSMLI